MIIQADPLMTGRAIPVAVDYHAVHFDWSGWPIDLVAWQITYPSAWRTRRAFFIRDFETPRFGRATYLG